LLGGRPIGHIISGVQRLSLVVVVTSAVLLTGCSEASPLDGPVFVGADHRVIECEDRPGATCVEVSSQVDGGRDGIGSCILYAVTGDGQVAVAASGDLDLIPGSSVEWTVQVPSHFDLWNPVCRPTAER
jgi:hypothetical protein